MVTNVGWSGSPKTMRFVLFCAFVCGLGVAVLPSEAFALGVDVACAKDAPDCSPVSLTETPSAYTVELGAGSEESARFSKRANRRGRPWWLRRFWRRWRNPPIDPPNDPIAPTPDPVPEPGTLGLMAVGGAFVANRIRKRRSLAKA